MRSLILVLFMFLVCSCTRPVAAPAPGAPTDGGAAAPVVVAPSSDGGPNTQVVMPQATVQIATPAKVAPPDMTPAATATTPPIGD